MTEFTAYAVYLLGAAYLLLSAYVLFGGWRSTDGRLPVRLIWFLVLPIGLFIVLWYSGQWIWTLLFWVFVFGDAGPYEEYGKHSSAIVALAISASAYARLAFGKISLRYLRLTSWGTGAMAALLLIMLTHEFTNRIYGWSVRGAAENYLAKFHGENHPFTAPDAPRRIIEENVPRPEDDPTQLGNSRRFVLYYGNAPIQDARVVPYGWFWWTFGSSQPMIPVTDMDSAVAHWDTDREEATERLNAIIRKYPNSDASRWASTTLKRLQEHGKSGTPGWRSEMMKRLREEARRRKAAAAPH